MNNNLWQVVPLSCGQLKDVNPKDILAGGLFRKCDTYKGGGGYDEFPDICNHYIGEKPHLQFVVQLRGCNLDCPYCYVTRAGVWGSSVKVTTDKLAEAYQLSKLEVFHLMGGAPALYRQHWPELITCLFERCPQAIFHSDLMLTENVYRDLNTIAHPRAVYAINIKGLNSREFKKNTRKDINWPLFWGNFRAVQKSKLQTYITFTGVNLTDLDSFWKRAHDKGVYRPRDLFIKHIDLIEYKAAPYVDSSSWGGAAVRNL